MIISMDKYSQPSSAMDFIIGDRESKVLSMLCYSYQHYVLGTDRNDFYYTQEKMYLMSGINPNKQNTIINMFRDYKLIRKVDHRLTYNSAQPVRHFDLDIKRIQEFEDDLSMMHKNIFEKYMVRGISINKTKIQKECKEILDKKYMSKSHTAISETDIQHMSKQHSKNKEENKYKNNNTSVLQTEDIIKEFCNPMNPYLGYQKTENEKMFEYEVATDFFDYDMDRTDANYYKFIDS